MKSDDLVKVLGEKSRNVHFLVRTPESGDATVFEAAYIDVAFKGTDQETVVVIIEPAFRYNEKELKPIVLQ